MKEITVTKARFSDTPFVRILENFGYFIFLTLTSIFLAVVCRGGVGFLIDPIPRWIDFALFFFWLAVVLATASRTRLGATFFFDKTARRVMFTFFFFWLIWVSVHAACIAAADAYLDKNALLLWKNEYRMIFPCSFLLMEDTYTWSLYMEGIFLKNPILSKFLLFCVYWPLIFLAEGVAFWSFLFFALRAVKRVFCWLFFRKTDRYRCRLSSSAAPAQNTPFPAGKRGIECEKPILGSLTSGTNPAAAEQGQSSGAIGKGAGEPRKPFYSRHLPFCEAAVLGLFILAALFWGFFITTNVRKAQVWHQDFVSVRILLSRFYHQNGRLPQNWDEIVEAPDKLPVRSADAKGLVSGEHYFRNPNLSWRAELNFKHLARINAETAEPIDDWIFRVAAQSKMNPTGEREPFMWEQWQINLNNIIVYDRMMRSLPSAPAAGEIPFFPPENRPL